MEKAPQAFLNEWLLEQALQSNLSQGEQPFSVFCSNEDIDEGFVVNQEGVGLRLTAMQYWKCSKAGISLPFPDKKEPDCKFVIAESLPHEGTTTRLTFQIILQFIVVTASECIATHILGRNQVDTFLEQHRGAGVQHVALYTKNIVSTAHAMAEAGVQFFSPPPAYYTEVCTRLIAIREKEVQKVSLFNAVFFFKRK